VSGVAVGRARWASLDSFQRHSIVLVDREHMEAFYAINLCEREYVLDCAT
jgi:hypothetical protein